MVLLFDDSNIDAGFRQFEGGRQPGRAGPEYGYVSHVFRFLNVVIPVRYTGWRTPADV